MSRQLLKKPSGEVLGWINTDNPNRLTAHDSNGVLVGWYLAEANTTYNKNSILVGKGNLLSTLI